MEPLLEFLGVTYPASSPMQCSETRERELAEVGEFEFGRAMVGGSAKRLNLRLGWIQLGRLLSCV